MYDGVCWAFLAKFSKNNTFHKQTFLRVPFLIKNYYYLCEGDVCGACDIAQIRQPEDNCGRLSPSTFTWVSKILVCLR